MKKGVLVGVIIGALLSVAVLVGGAGKDGNVGSLIFFAPHWLIFSFLLTLDPDVWGWLQTLTVPLFIFPPWLFATYGAVLGYARKQGHGRGAFWAVVVVHYLSLWQRRSFLDAQWSFLMVAAGPVFLACHVAAYVWVAGSEGSARRQPVQ